MAGGHRQQIYHNQSVGANIPAAKMKSRFRSHSDSRVVTDSWVGAVTLPRPKVQNVLPPGSCFGRLLQAVAVAFSVEQPFFFLINDAQLELYKICVKAIDVPTFEFVLTFVYHKIPGK